MYPCGLTQLTLAHVCREVARAGMSLTSTPTTCFTSLGANARSLAIIFSSPTSSPFHTSTPRHSDLVHIELHVPITLGNALIELLGPVKLCNGFISKCNELRPSLPVKQVGGLSDTCSSWSYTCTYTVVLHWHVIVHQKYPASTKIWHHAIKLNARTFSTHAHLCWCSLTFQQLFSSFRRAIVSDL